MEVELRLEPEEGWSEFSLPTVKNGTFVNRDPDSDRLRVAYYQRDADGAIVGKAWFGPGAQGPPAHAHGGAVAAVLDEAMGCAVWMEGHLALAASLNCQFRRSVPLGTTAVFEVRIDRKDGRKIYTASTLKGPDGVLFSEAEGLYVEVPHDRIREMLRQGQG